MINRPFGTQFRLVVVLEDIGHIFLEMNQILVYHRSRVCRLFQEFLLDQVDLSMFILCIYLMHFLHSLTVTTSAARTTRITNCTICIIYTVFEISPSTITPACSLRFHWYRQRSQQIPGYHL